MTAQLRIVPETKTTPVESPQLGLLVTGGRSRSLLDRLAKRWPAAELLGQRCDVLVLGEPGTGII